MSRIRRSEAARRPAPAPPAAEKPKPTVDATKPENVFDAGTLKSDRQFLAALRSDNAHILDAGTADAKLERLEVSPFVFFRGTAGLFFRRLQGMDADKPRTMVAGDVHPENFGVMQSADGKLSFGVDDFDEAALAPFSFDLRRGATGFSLLAADRGFSKREKKAIVKAFVDGYRDAIGKLAGSDKEGAPFVHAKDPPKILEELFKKSRKTGRSRLLDKYTDKKGAFKAREGFRPVPEKRAELQRAIDKYRQTLSDDAPHKNTFYKVKDVGIRDDAGTASLGLTRYYVLVEGASKSDKDDVIIELKESMPSALLGLGGSPLHLRYSSAAQASRAAHVMRAGEDPLYGHVEMGGKSFLVRERSPKVIDPDLGTWDAKQIADYAEVCGSIVAVSHARHGDSDEKIAPVMTREFSKELVDFGLAADAQLTQDHARYCALREVGKI